MKTTKRLIYPLLIIGVIITIAASCGKDDEVTGVKDADGNSYKTVTIGSQVWMAENLKTTKYRDGLAIANVTVNAEWGVLTTAAYAVYGNSADNGTNYGALYNWYAVNSGKLCPTGWHVPTKAEWTTLITFAGGENTAGGKLKSTRTAPTAAPSWLSPNTGATDAYGFAVVPGGFRMNGGSFGLIGEFSYFWSSTENSSTLAEYNMIVNDQAYVASYPGLKGIGASVRCVKD
jgi:uncharacterized protein (TIGR02145 family)